MTTTPALGFRRTAYVIWGALLFGVLTFAAVAAFVGPSFRQSGEPAPLFLADLSVALAVVGVLASRIVPSQMRPRPGAEDPDALAMSRNIVASGLCEGTGLFGVITWMLTGSERSVLAIAIAVAGILACFPSDSRWRSLVPATTGQRGPSGPSRMVR